MVVHNSMKSLTISTRLLYVLYEGNKNKFHHDHDIFFSITNPTWGTLPGLFQLDFIVAFCPLETRTPGNSNTNPGGFLRNFNKARRNSGEIWEKFWDRQVKSLDSIFISLLPHFSDDYYPGLYSWALASGIEQILHPTKRQQALAVGKLQAIFKLSKKWSRNSL